MREVINRLFGKIGYMLKNRKELIELIELGYDIKKIINSWDPIVLMEFCPEDEYEAEIKGIRNLVANNRNIDKKLLGQEIKKIFRYYFSNDYNSEKNIEEKMGHNVYTLKPYVDSDIGMASYNYIIIYKSVIEDEDE